MSTRNTKKAVYAFPILSSFPIAQPVDESSVGIDRFVRRFRLFFGCIPYLTFYTFFYVQIPFPKKDSASVCLGDARPGVQVLTLSLLLVRRSRKPTREHHNLQHAGWFCP